MNLTPHFRLEEMTISSTALAHNIANDPTPEHLANLRQLARKLEEVRAIFGAVIEITSGYRNPRINKLVGGVPTSAHARGLAADFHVFKLDDLEVAKRIRDSNITFDQLIYEKNRCVHLSIEIDGPMRRQVLRQPGGPKAPVYVGLEP